MIINGMPLWAWIFFYALVLIMLVADLKMFGRKGEHEVNVNEALRMTAVWIGVSLLFCAGIYFFYPSDSHEMALEFLAGYLIEKSLSMDNLFVFLMLFSFFGIERKYQHEVLFWGIFGALVLRSIFIFAGVKMLLAMNEYINSLAAVMGFRLNVPHIEVPTPLSLAVIFGVLLFSMLFSVVVTRNKGTTPNIK